MKNEFPADTDGLEDSWKQLKRKLTKMQQQQSRVFSIENIEILEVMRTGTAEEERGRSAGTSFETNKRRRVTKSRE